MCVRSFGVWERLLLYGSVLLVYMSLCLCMCMVYEWLSHCWQILSLYLHRSQRSRHTISA